MPDQRELESLLAVIRRRAVHHRQARTVRQPLGDQQLPDTVDQSDASQLNHRKHNLLLRLGAGPFKQFVSHLMGDAQNLGKGARHVNALAAQIKTGDLPAETDDDVKQVVVGLGPTHRKREKEEILEIN